MICPIVGMSVGPSASSAEPPRGRPDTNVLLQGRRAERNIVYFRRASIVSRNRNSIFVFLAGVHEY
jgi:hypothetical protein